MKKLTTYGKALWAIAEKPLLVGMGVSIALAAVLKIETEQLRLMAVAVGVLSFLAGLLPMFAAFAKANWPSKGSK